MISISRTNGPGFSLLLGAAIFMMSVPALAQSQEDIRQLRMICSDPAVQQQVRARAQSAGQLEDVELEIEERCPQIDLPSTPVHDIADVSPEASHSDWVYHARYSRDGRTIVSGGRDGTVRVWDTQTGRPTSRIVVPQSDPSQKQGAVRSVTFVGDGTRVAATSDKNPVRLIELATGKIVASFPVAGDCCGGTIAGTTSGLLFIGGHTAMVDAIDVSTGAVRYRLPGHQIEASSIAVSETAGLVATGAAGKHWGKPEEQQKPRVHLWRLDSGKKIAAFEPTGGDRPHRLAFSRDGARLAVFIGRSVHIYSVADKRITQTIGPISARFAVAFTADGKGLIVCGRHPILWDLATGKRLRHFGPFSDLCHSVDVSPDGRFAVTTSMGSDLRIWEIATGAFYRRIGSNVRAQR